MTPITSRYNADEAKKELLATIHASRDLGPQMDDALTDRYMEQLGKLRPAGSFDPIATRSRLQTLLNTLRGSDPAGDDAAAESFLEGIQPPRVPTPAYGAYPPPPLRPYGPEFGPMVRYRGGPQVSPFPFIAILIICAVAFSSGQHWMLFFVLPLLFGASRRGRYQRRYDREQWRAYRHNRIIGPDDPYGHGQLPPSGPPEVL